MSQLQSGLSLFTRVGPAPQADGTLGYFRADRELNLLIAQGKGKWSEAALRDQIYAACTAVTGQAWLTSNTAATMLDVSNPPGSGVRVEILRTWLAYVSGTLGAGSILHGIVPQQLTTPTGGAAVGSTNCHVGGRFAGPVTTGQGRTMVATPTPLWPWASSFPELATSANPLQMITDYIDGAIVLEPGNAFCEIGVLGAVGTSPVVQLGVMYRLAPLI